jgi:hypothetical protein
MTDVTDAPIVDQPVTEASTEGEREVRLDPSQALDWADVSVSGHPKDEEAEEEEPETPEVEEPKEAPFIEAPVQLVDPGEYTPADYSFEVEVEGKKTKITTPEQAAEFADENADKFTSAQILSFLRQSQSMENKLASDKADYDDKKAEYNEKKSEADAQQESINTIAAEITYLVSKGKLPKVDPQYLSADWTDKEIAKQPGVKEQVSLLNYMRDENIVREKAGLKPITSAIDAWNAWQLEEKNSEEDDTKKQAAAARKAAGARVSGSSPNPVSLAPKGIAVGRAMNLTDLETF